MNNPFRQYLLLALFAPFIHFIPLAAYAEIVVPVKSPVDDNLYRGLELANGMKVMLVSDPQTDQAAASLDVYVGSGSDPADWNGLAHFLEHMLFLGTEKYPRAGEYQEFIQSRGGGHNAYTSYDHTNYFFNVNFDSLAPALDRFSRFFIDPTFDSKYVERERSVVHSEYQARSKDEGRRIWAAHKRILNPGHPASRFSVGSEKTLRDRDGQSVRERLVDFYRQWYSADIMALTVVGRESLDQLEQMVRDRFSDVPQRDVEPPVYVQSYLNRDLAPVRLGVVPDKEVNSVTFSFAIPSTYAEYRNKPLNYIANLLGDEGRGSLLALLKQRGWAEKLSAGPGFMDRHQGTFQIHIGLTESGVDHIDEIGELLFQAIRLIRQNGVNQWRFDEIKRLGDIAFRFAEEKSPSSLARTLSSRLQEYPMEEVLRAPLVVEQFDPGRINQLLGMLTPDKVYLQVVSRDIRARNVSPWYDVGYRIDPLGESTVTRWQKALRGGVADGQDPALALPEPNRFIPERLDMLDPGRASTTPRPLDVDGVQAWYRGDQSFQTPRASFYFSIQSPQASATARQAVLTELLVRMLNDQLNIETYPARLAGMHYNLYRHSRGITVRLGGYQDKQPELLKLILDTIRNPRLDPDRLALMKAELARELKNASRDRPTSQTIREIHQLLIHPYWTEPEQLAEIDSVTVEEIGTFIDRLTAALSLTTLAHGDISAGQAKQMSSQVAGTFADATLLEGVARPELRRLPDSGRYLRTMDIDHTDTALSYYFQGENKTVAARARAHLLAQLIESPFYYELRTSNRVGYVVFASYFDMLEVPGILFTVQSPSHSAAQLAQLIDSFLGNLSAELGELDDAAFAQMRKGLVAQILQRDTTLSERSNRYWREIDREEYDFDTRQRLAREISALSRADMQDYLDRLVTRDRRQLVVQSPGRRDGAAADRIRDAQWIETGPPESFRQSLDQYFE